MNDKRQIAGCLEKRCISQQCLCFIYQQRASSVPKSSQVNSTQTAMGGCVVTKFILKTFGWVVKWMRTLAEFQNM
jgi:hypothetical protein